MRERLHGFFRGMAQAFDLSGVLGPRMPDWYHPGDGFKSDAEALRRDWEAVGRYFPVQSAPPIRDKGED